MRQDSRWTAIALAASVTLAGACAAEAPSRSENVGASRLRGTIRPCVPPPTIPRSPGALAMLLPRGVSLPDDAAIVSATDTDGSRTVVARTAMSPSDLHARYKAQVEAAGYAVLKLDDEVIEAELYFSLPDGSLGLAQQVRARCPEGATQTIVSTVASGTGPVTTVPHPRP